MNALILVTVSLLIIALGIMVGWMIHRSKQDVFFNDPEFIEIGEENDTSNNN